MAVYRPDDFLTRLLRSGLVSPKQLEKARRHVARAARDIPPSSHMWADALVSLGCVTRYQAQELIDGTSSDLALGGYVVLEEVGSGQGLSRVLRARDRRGADEVAVKVFQDGVADRVRLVNRCHERMELASRLQHPNIVHVRRTDWSKESGPVVIRDFVKGSDARRLTTNRGRLAPGEVLGIGRQVCDALGYAHRHGLAHRNIKPANILVAYDGHAQLADFGLIRLAADGDLGALRQFENVWDFVAPEQAVDPTRIDPRSDLYSLGCTLYYLLTGRPPFPETGVMAKLLAHQSKAPRHVCQLAPETPEVLARAVHKLMAKRPDARFHSAAEVGDVLRQTSATRVTAMSGYDLSRWSPAQGWKRRRARPRQGQIRRWLIGAAAAAAGALAIWWAAGRSPKPAAAPPPTQQTATDHAR